MSVRATTLNLDTGYFVAFVAAGIGIMVLCKSLGVPQIWVTSIVAGLVVAYSFAVVHFGRLHLRLDQAGDNAYYLGLVYTLSSMAWALWEVGAALQYDGGPTTTEIVIGNFGLALISTLAGIICRIVLHQMRLDPADVEKESRFKLASASSSMVATLHDVETQFGRFMYDSQQRHRDYFDELTKSHDELREKMQEAMHEAVQGVRDSLSKATETLSEAMQKMAKETDKETEALALATERLRALEPPPARLSKRFGDLAAQVEVMQQKLEGINDRLSGTTDALGQGALAMQETGRSLQGLGQGLEVKLVEQQQHVMREVSAVRDSMSSLNMAVKEVSAQADQFAKTTEKTRAAADIAQRSALETLQRLTAVVETVDASLVSKAESLE